MYHSDLAENIRRMVPARAAAEHYGFTPNRAGYICCPFHGERTPSLKLYEDGGWHCFGCGRGGSSIDFVMELFSLDFRRAVVRLDLDFSLNLTGARPSPGEASAVLERRRREREALKRLDAREDFLCKEHLRLHRNMQLYAPDGPNIEELHPLFAEALKRLPEVQYQLDVLEAERREIEHGQQTAGPGAAARVQPEGLQVRPGV